mmetsp:Transcript_25011/g.58686  ORF Transcript_25011/g.58686 Transcript_25011/m.58686 type:complete len:332 (-) Transcript_25011:16-1011(-)
MVFGTSDLGCVSFSSWVYLLLFLSRCGRFVVVAVVAVVSEDGSLAEGRKHEGRPVDLRGVVPEVLPKPERPLRDLAGAPALGRDDEPDLPRRVGRDRRVGVLDGGEGRPDRIDQRPDEVQVQPHALSLRADDPPLPEALVHGVVEGRLEEDRRRSDGIRRVRDDHVEGVLVLLHELRPVHDLHGHPRIVVPYGEARQVLLGGGDDPLVDLALDDLLHAVVTGDLPEDASVPPADHQDPFGIRVGHQRDVRDHLLVGELVAGRHLDDPVQDQDGPVVLRLEDQQVLEVRPVVVQDLFHLERHGLALPELSPFVEPAVDDQIHSVYTHDCVIA